MNCKSAESIAQSMKEVERMIEMIMEKERLTTASLANFRQRMILQISRALIERSL